MTRVAEWVIRQGARVRAEHDVDALAEEPVEAFLEHAFGRRIATGVARTPVRSGSHRRGGCFRMGLAQEGIVADSFALQLTQAQIRHDKCSSASRLPGQAPIEFGTDATMQKTMHTCREQRRHVGGVLLMHEHLEPAIRSLGSYGAIDLRRELLLTAPAVIDPKLDESHAERGNLAHGLTRLCRTAQAVQYSRPHAPLHA